MTEEIDDGSSSKRILTLDITLAELNPNHKYRLALLGLDSRWLADVSFVKRDESIYIMPLINKEYTLDMPDSVGQRVQYQVLPNSGFHISLHASETINVTVGGRRVSARARSEPQPRIGPIFAIVVNSPHTLLPAPEAEVNNPPGGIRAMPLPGVWRPLPVGLTFYRSRLDHNWQPQTLSDLAQVHLHLSIRSKTFRYHVIVWQNASFIPTPGEVAVLFP